MIDCIHDGNKTKMTVLYHGKETEVSACDDCKKIIEESSVCEVLSNG